MATAQAGAMPRLTADDLRRLPDPTDSPSDCACKHLKCAGWESVTAPLAAPLLQPLGTLRDATREDEPTLEEFHPGGTRYGSETAPVAPAFFPYNRCTVWTCAACGRGFLQYTEFGGYYVDHRLREVDPRRVVG